MEALISESLILGRLYPLYDKLREIASRSIAAHILFAIMSWIGRLCDRSLLKHLFSSECLTDSKWKSSITYRVVFFLVNLIPNLLHRIYRKGEKVFSGSYFVLFLSRIGSFAPYLVCFTLLLLLSIHHSYWNNMYSLILIFAALLLLWLRNIKHSDGKIDIGSVGFWPIVFIFISLASAGWSEHPNLSLRFIFFAVTCALIVGVCCSGIRSEKQFSLLLLACAAGIIICSVYGFYQRFIVGIPASSSFTDLAENANMPGRVYSFFDNPNACANVLVFFTPIMMCLAIYSRKRSMKAVFGIAFIFGIAAMLMTYSRGAWISFAVAFAAVIIILRPRLIPFFIILIFIALPFLPSNILNRLLTVFSGSDSSINSRTYIYTAMYRIIKDHVLSGIGLGCTNLKKVMGDTGYYLASFPFIHAHSIYLEIWAESGIIALVSFLLSIFFALKKTFQAAKSKCSSPLVKGCAAGCFGGILGSMVFGITDYAWSYPRVMALFWFLMAIGYTASRLSRISEGKLNAGNII